MPLNQNLLGQGGQMGYQTYRSPNIWFQSSASRETTSARGRRLPRQRERDASGQGDERESCETSENLRVIKLRAVNIKPDVVGFVRRRWRPTSVATIGAENRSWWCFTPMMLHADDAWRRWISLMRQSELRLAYGDREIGVWRSQDRCGDRSREERREKEERGDGGRNDRGFLTGFCTGFLWFCGFALGFLIYQKNRWGDHGRNTDEGITGGKQPHLKSLCFLGWDY